ncbi:hypothetical protein AGMMS49928_29470 [Spirochaetia bacterium]|nr:hypothetical protein AGMMS49928_29470 [Spirochaetia bacterium]
MPNITQTKPVSDFMSIDACEHDIFQAEVYRKLREAEIQAGSTTKRYTHNEIMTRLQGIIDGK